MQSFFESKRIFSFLKKFKFKNKVKKKKILFFPLFSFIRNKYQCLFGLWDFFNLFGILIWDSIFL